MNTSNIYVKAYLKVFEIINSLEILRNYYLFFGGKNINFEFGFILIN